MTGTLLTTRNTGTDKKQALLLKFGSATDRIGEVRVTSIDDDVALLEVRLKLLDERVDSRASLDEKDDFAGRLELGAELFDRVSADDGLAWRTQANVSEYALQLIIQCD